MTTTILVTGSGGPAGRTLGAQLAQRARAGADLRLVGLDSDPSADPSYAVVEAVAAAADPDYARSMHDAVARHAPDLVVPTVSDELPQVAVLAGTLWSRAPRGTGGAGPAVVTSDAAATAVAADKLLTMWALRRAGVPVPPFAPATAFTTTARALEWAAGPLVVKPRVSRGGRGVQVVERPEDVPWTEIDGSWIVQGFAGGTEYSPQVYRSPATGRTTVVVLEKTSMREGRVGNAVDVLRLPGDAVPDVRDVAARTVEALGLVGPVDMDVRRDASGAPVVLEVNSRFGAQSAHAPELLDAVLAEWLGDAR